MQIKKYDFWKVVEEKECQNSLLSLRSKGYHIFPDPRILATYNYENLQSVSGLVISNKYGNIIFEEPVDLSNNSHSNSIEIWPTSVSAIGLFANYKVQVTLYNISNNRLKNTKIIEENCDHIVNITKEKYLIDRICLNPDTHCLTFNAKNLTRIDIYNSY